MLEPNEDTVCGSDIGKILAYVIVVSALVGIILGILDHYLGVC